MHRACVHNLALIWTQTDKKNLEWSSGTGYGVGPGILWLQLERLSHVCAALYV